MRKTVLLSSLATLLLGAASAHAAHLSCSNSSNIPSADLIGFDLTISVPVSNTGTGSGVGKETTTLSVTLPVDANLVPLSQFVAAGRHSASCLVTDSKSNLELSLRNVVFTKLEVISGPTATGATQTVVQLGLAFESLSTITTP